MEGRDVVRVYLAECWDTMGFLKLTGDGFSQQMSPLCDEATTVAFLLPGTGFWNAGYSLEHFVARRTL